MKLRKITSIVSNISLIAAFLTCVSFILGSVVVGGMAFNGRIEGGEFFLGSGSEETRVAASVFYYSLWHGISAVALIVFAIIISGINQILWQGKPGGVARAANKKASIYDYAVLISAGIFAVLVIAWIIGSAWAT